MSDLTAAVEAGARAMFDAQQAQRRDAERLRPDGRPWQWDDLDTTGQHALRSFVLPIVTAALAAAEPDCEHPDVRTFRSIPPHSKCLTCGALVERKWVTT